MRYDGITELLGLQAWSVSSWEDRRKGEVRIRLKRDLPFYTCSRCGERTAAAFSDIIPPGAIGFP